MWSIPRIPGQKPAQYQLDPLEFLQRRYIWIADDPNHTDVLRMLQQPRDFGSSVCFTNSFMGSILWDCLVSLSPFNDRTPLCCTEIHLYHLEAFSCSTVRLLNELSAVVFSERCCMSFFKRGIEYCNPGTQWLCYVYHWNYCSPSVKVTTYHQVGR